MIIAQLIKIMIPTNDAQNHLFKTEQFLWVTGLGFLGTAVLGQPRMLKAEKSPGEAAMVKTVGHQRLANLAVVIMGNCAL